MPSVSVPAERRSESRLRRHRLIPALRFKRDSISVWLDSPNTDEVNRKLRIKKLAREEIFRHKMAIVRGDLIHHERRALMRAGIPKSHSYVAARKTITREFALDALNKRTKKSAEEELD